MPPILATVQANQAALAQSIAQGVARFNNQFAGRNQLNLQINAKSFSRPLGAIAGDLRQFEASLAASNARVIAFGASTAVIGGVAKIFKDLTVATIEVEKALTDVNRVFGLSAQNLQSFSKELFNISKSTASAFSEVASAALEFSRQGLSTEETLRRVNDALTLTRLTGVSTAQAVEELTAVVNAYADSALNTTDVLNKIVAVEQRFAVSAADLTTAVSRTGQAAQEAGVNFDELNALVTAVQERTARGGAVIGNAFRTIFTRIGNNETLNSLEQLNIAVRDVQGNTLPATQILRNLAVAYDGLADSTRNSVAKQVAGTYQINILQSLLSDLKNTQGDYTEALRIGIGATNEASVANAQLNKTIAALISQTGTDLTRLGSNLGKVTFDPVFRSLIKPFDDAIVYINDLLEGESLGSDFANGLLKGVRNVLAGPGLVAAGTLIYKLTANTFRDIAGALPSIIGITTESQKRRAVEEAVLKIIQDQDDVAKTLLADNGNLAAQQRTLLSIAQNQTDQYTTQLNLARQLAPLLSAQNVNVGKAGLQVGRIKAEGHIPIYAGGGIPNSVRSRERRGAFAGGYSPGSVIAAPKSVGGVMNTAEKVRHVSGFSQPFINPPQNSKAGIAHRINSIVGTGVDPYHNTGFVPDFSATGLPLSSGGGKAVSHKKISDVVNKYIKSVNLATIDYKKVSADVNKLLKQFDLNTKSLSTVNRAAVAFAKAQQKAAQTISSNPGIAGWTSATRIPRIVRSSSAGGPSSTAAQQAILGWTGAGAVTPIGIRGSLGSSLMASSALAGQTAARRNAFGSASFSPMAPFAGIMSGGVMIPPPKLPKAGYDWKGLNDKFNRASLPIAFGLPMISGLAEQSLYGNKSRFDLTSGERGMQSFLSAGLPTVGTAAAIGSSFGPVGTAAGAAIGGIYAFITAIDATKLSLEELVEVNNKQKQSNQELLTDASAYLSSIEDRNKLILAGSSTDKIAEASRKLHENFLNIKDTNLQQIFRATGANVEEMSKKLGEYTKNLSRETSFKDFILGEKLSNKESAFSLFSGVKDSPDKAKKLRSTFLQALTAQETLKSTDAEYKKLSESPKPGTLFAPLQEKRTQATRNYETALSTILELGGIAKDDSEEYAQTLEQLKKTIEKKGIVGILEELRKILKITETEKGSVAPDAGTLDLLKLRISLPDQAANQSNATIIKLKNQDFSRKLEQDLFNFQQQLSESFTDPLVRIRKNLDFQSSDLEKQYLSDVESINNEFATKTLDELKDKITDPAVLARLSGSLAVARTGDFSGVRRLSTNKGFNDASGGVGSLALRDALRTRDFNEKQASERYKNELKSAKQNSEIETEKAKNIQNASNLVKEEISIANFRERIEVLRKNNIELEIDALERAAADPAQLLGKGVEGKAAEKNRFRNLVLQKKLQDDEITKSRSAQQEYNKVLEVQRQILVDQGSQSEVRKFLPMELKTREDIQKAVEQISKITFVDTKQEEDRVQTLGSLQKIQEEIVAGKIKEEEITRRINEEETRNAKRSRSFKFGLATGLDEIRDDVDTFENRFGRTIPHAFRDGIVGALDAAMNKTDDLNEAMLEVASNFLRTIQNAMFEQIAGTVVSGVGSAFARQRGGAIRAQNGMYISGGRTGDKNPALLEDGEYVLNRNAVKAMGGPGVLNGLNFGMFPRFAGGGSNSGSFSASAAMVEPFGGLSEFGRENSPEYQAYVDRLREAEAIKEAKKAKEKALINQLISTAITSAVAVGFSSVSRGGVNGVRGASNPLKTPQTSPYSSGTMMSQSGGYLRFNSGGYLPYGSRLSDTVPAMLSGGEYIVNSGAVRRYGVGGLNRINAGVAKYQDGGLVGSSGSPNSGNTSVANAGNISISITVNASNGKMDNEQTSSSGSGRENDTAKLADRIKDVVLEVITDQQRTGGLLDSTKKK